MDSVIKMIKEKVPKRFRRGLRTVLHRPHGESLSIYNGNGSRLKKQTDALSRRCSRRLPVRITSGGIETAESLAQFTRARDLLIDKYLYSRNYTWEDMLVIVNPYGLTPASGLLLFMTEEETGVRVTVKGHEEENDLTGITPACRYHRVPLFGLYLGERNRIELTLLDQNGAPLKTKTIWVPVRSLPGCLKDTIALEESVAPFQIPLTLIAGKETPLPFAFDRAGDIRYYLDYRPKGYGLFPLSNGRFIFADREKLTPTFEIPHVTNIYEMDYFGRIHNVYLVEKGCHHEYSEKEPDGNLFMVSNSDEGVGDLVIEVNRQTGEIVKSLKMSDVVDCRYHNNVDWTHLNSICYRPEDHSIIVSPRNLHSVIKIDWETGELVWIFCHPRFWKNTGYEDKVLKPVGEMHWHFQQHAVYYLPEDLDGDPQTSHIIMFDNHWHKRRPVKYFDEDPNSYVKIFAIHEKTRTIKLERSYPCVKSKITSNAILDYENRRVYSMGAYLDPEIDGRQGMIYEYDFETAEVLNRFSLRFFYYRGYPVRFNYEDLCSPMDPGEDYIHGSLKKPVRWETPVPVPREALPAESGVTFYRTDDILYMRSRDHSVTQVCFSGASHTFMDDFSGTTQTRDIFSDWEYDIGIPLSELQPDFYQIRICYQDQWYDTGKTIQIRSR